MRTFVLATVGVTLVLELLFFGIVLLAFFVWPLFPMTIADQAMHIAPRLAPMVTTAGRQAQLTREVEALGDGLVDEHRRRSDGFNFSLRRDYAQTASVTVTNRDGQVLAVRGESLTIGAPLLSHLPAEEAAVLHAALSGESAPEKLGLRAQDGSAFAAVPLLRNGSSSVVGAMIVRIIVPFHLLTTLRAVAESGLPIGLGALGVSALAGGIAGYVAARTIAQRLHRIASAAEEWGQGEFSSRAPELPADELGRFATQLNGIAGTMRDTVSLRQQMAVLEERRRLARDLHDTVKQEMFALSLQLTALRVQASAEGVEARDITRRIATLEEMAARVQRELTGLLRELRPIESSAPPHPPFPAALRDLVEGWQRHSHIPVTLDISNAALPGLSETIRSDLLRIASEALANVERHSGATQVTITFEQVRDRLMLAVEDNGKGGARETRPGMGLQGMRERVERWPGGALQIRSRPGEGTHIDIIIDLPTDRIQEP